MSRLIIPVTHWPLRATGDERLWIDIDLLIRDGAGSWHPQRFRVDNGTEITTFPAYKAKQLSWVVPARPALVQHRQSPLEVRPGMFRFRIDGMDQTEYAVNCLYLGDPDVVPPANAPTASVPRYLLQPLALLRALRFTMEQDPTGVSQYGQLVVEKV
jgi:hypothetical protein